MISSTIRDLPEHRESVRRACLGVGVMPSMMEDWPALDADGVSASLKKVDDADIYVGIFGHRYGYVPAGHDVSITEMEYDRAVHRGIPRLIFIMHDEHPLTISQVEIAGVGKLERLKERLRKERTVSFFRSVAELGGSVIRSLTTLGGAAQTSGGAGGTLPEVNEPSYHPRNYVFFVPYRPKGKQVVGRDADVESVRAQLVSGRRSAIGQTASFRGLGGLGKTQLAVEYAYRFRDQYPNGVIWLNADQDIEAQLIEVAERGQWVSSKTEHRDKLAIAEQRPYFCSEVIGCEGETAGFSTS